MSESHDTLKAWLSMARLGNAGAVSMLRRVIASASEKATDKAVIRIAEEIAAIYRDDMRAHAESN